MGVAVPFLSVPGQDCGEGALGCPGVTSGCSWDTPFTAERLQFHTGWDNSSNILEAESIFEQK